MPGSNEMCFCNKCYATVIERQLLDKYDIQVLKLLSDQDATIGELRKALKVSQIVITRVLAKLTGALAVSFCIEGRASRYEITAGGRHLLQQVKG